MHETIPRYKMDILFSHVDYKEEILLRSRHRVGKVLSLIVEYNCFKKYRFQIPIEWTFKKQIKKEIKQNEDV